MPLIVTPGNYSTSCETCVPEILWKSGYLVSNYARPEDLGQLIKGSTKLGEVVDLYSYKVLEELIAPLDGYLFFSRYPGMVGGGTQAFALAEAAVTQQME